MKGKLLSILIAVILLTIVFSGCFEEKKKTISIQELIDNASPGDTINISAGTYYENIFINKPINLVGEDKNTTIIDGNNKRSVLYIYADYVNISGFTIQDSSEDDFDAGILFNNSNYSSIDNNIIINNKQGIVLGYSSNNTISGNTINKNSQYGVILVYSSNDNTISDNTISHNDDGIGLADSNNNAVSGNIISDNLEGIALGYSSNNAVSGNTISNNSIYGIDLGYSSNSTISGNTIINNDEGIGLGDSNNNVVSGNTISHNNKDGISFSFSNNNTIYDNIINNNEGGILFLFSNNNIVYHNNLINNTPNVLGTENNTWYDVTSDSGNYWSDYKEKYPNASQLNNYLVGLIWDTPYNITGGNNQDLYPLFAPFNI